MVWWLRTHAPTAGGTSSILGRGTKIPQAPGVAKKKKKSRDLRFVPSRHHSAQPGHEMLDKYGMNLEFTRSLVPALVPVDVGNAEMESDWGSALTCS